MSETDDELIHKACEARSLPSILKPFFTVTQSGKRQVLLTAAGYDMLALKSGEYLGADEVEFGPDKALNKPLMPKLSDYAIPEYARQTVYRHTAHGTATFTAKIYAQEYLNDISHVRNIHMFMTKWVHCVAIRLAFADIIGSDVAAEELDANMDFTRGALGAVELKATVRDIEAPELYINGHKRPLAPATIIQIPPVDSKQDIEKLIEEAFGRNDSLGG